MSVLRSFLLPFSKSKSEGSVKNEQQQEETIQEVIDTASLDDIYPFSWEEKADHIEAGSNYIRILTITGYPSEQFGNWLSELKRKKGNITISQHLQSADDSKMVHHYNELIKNKTVEMEKSVDPYHKKQLKKAINSANNELDKYLESQTTYLEQSTYIFLQAKSMDELDNLNENIRKTLQKLGLKELTPNKAMHHAFWSALPIQQNLLKDYTSRLSNTEAASSFMPFDDAEILDLSPTSQIEGVNRETGSLIGVNYLDEEKVLNQNMVIIGTSGVGKTTYIVQKIMRTFAMGFRSFIIDPENEYSEIVKALGGQVIHLSSNALTKINPFEIFSSDTGNNQQHESMEYLIKNKIQRLKTFFQVIKPDLSQVEKAILDRVIHNTYVNKGVYTFQSIDDMTAEDFPILSDLYHELGKLKQDDIERFERVKDFYYILESYCTGSNTIFNGYTNVSLESQIVSFNLFQLQNEVDVQAAAYLNTFSYLWDAITKNKDETVYCFIDEFHFLSKNPDSMRFFYDAYKRFRKYNAGAIAGTQQIQDVLDAADNLGPSIIGNSFTKVFFGLDNSGVDELMERLKENFSEEEKQLLRARRQGEALYVHGSNRAFMKVELTKEELRLWNQQRYEKEYKVSAEEKPNYEDEIILTKTEREEAKAFSMS
ncbi:VirB4 family type IV secretion system protein [Virgibacillus siamensis]|uniref:VirB4 family type IV secretion system protein n=1 Tax=Virgibacillus siamensis TaxID=480071 RepID=UPI000984B203|nr:DUF87 domain-containing protein [Virgibacillus siamensis]